MVILIKSINIRFVINLDFNAKDLDVKIKLYTQPNVRIQCLGSIMNRTRNNIH